MTMLDFGEERTDYHIENGGINHNGNDMISGDGEVEYQGFER